MAQRQSPEAAEQTTARYREMAARRERLENQLAALDAQMREQYDRAFKSLPEGWMIDLSTFKPVRPRTEAR
jgi:hypothetical protein